MSTEKLVARAVGALLEAQERQRDRFAEAIQTLRSVPGKLEHNEREEAARLLSAVADIELDLLGDCRTADALIDELGLDSEYERVHDEAFRRRCEKRAAARRASEAR